MDNNEKMKHAFWAAEQERLNNFAMLDNCVFIFNGERAPDGTHGNIFGKCHRVHVENCEITFIVENGETVAFIKPREKENLE